MTAAEAKVALHVARARQARLRHIRGDLVLFVRFIGRISFEFRENPASAVKFESQSAVGVVDGDTLPGALRTLVTNLSQPRILFRQPMRSTCRSVTAPCRFFIFKPYASSDPALRRGYPIPLNKNPRLVEKTTGQKDKSAKRIKQAHDTWASAPELPVPPPGFCLLPFGLRN